jgi:hypothetical protein
MEEEIIGRLPELTGAQIAHLEYGLRHERRRRAFAGGGEDAPHHHEDGYLHRHCCGSDRGDRLSRETYVRSQKGVRQGVRATLRPCM